MEQIKKVAPDYVRGVPVGRILASVAIYIYALAEMSATIVWAVRQGDTVEMLQRIAVPFLALIVPLLTAFCSFETHQGGG